MNESEAGRDGYLLCKGRRIYQVYKQDFPMEFWYGLTADANREDSENCIDIRTLPERYKIRPVEIHLAGMSRRSWAKAVRQQLLAHALAFSAAIADGYSLEAHVRQQKEIAEREFEAMRSIRSPHVYDDDIPF